MSRVLPSAWAHALTVAAVKEEGRGSGEHVARAAVSLGTCTHGQAWSCGSMSVVIGAFILKLFLNQSNSFDRGQSAMPLCFYKTLATSEFRRKS
jgi:hypothetical protein